MEKVLNTFREMGFEMQDAEELGYAFRYEGINFLYMPNEDDEDFLNITVPAIVEKEDLPEEAFSALLEKINSTLKYVKAYTLGDALWLFYERELFEEEDLEPVIARMILRLEAATLFVRQLLSPDEEENKGEEVEENDTDEVDDNETKTEV